MNLSHAKNISHTTWRKFTNYVVNYMELGYKNLQFSANIAPEVGKTINPRGNKGESMITACNTAYNVNVMNDHAKQYFGRAFGEVLRAYEGTYCKAVILCVGTDRITGDSLGPLTGYKLLPLFNKLASPPALYGTLETPVHALNMGDFVSDIYKKYSAPLVVVIDASLGLPRHIGRLTLKQGGIYPGSAVGKKMPAIGDISVTGVVNYYHCPEYSILQNTRLNTVMKMAEVISDGIFQGLTETSRLHGSF